MGRLEWTLMIGTPFFGAPGLGVGAGVCGGKPVAMSQANRSEEIMVVIVGKATPCPTVVTSPNDRAANLLSQAAYNHL